MSQSVTKEAEMSIYAKFDINGVPVGFYNEAIHNDIPEGGVDISEEQWKEFINNQGQRRWDGEKVVEYARVATDDELAATIRAQRDRLLAETDYLLMPDYPIAGEALDALAVYRQALRDITKQETFPLSVTWPDKPEI